MISMKELKIPCIWTIILIHVIALIKKIAGLWHILLLLLFLLLLQPCFCLVPILSDGCCVAMILALHVKEKVCQQHTDLVTSTINGLIKGQSLQVSLLVTSSPKVSTGLHQYQGSSFGEAFAVMFLRFCVFTFLYSCIFASCVCGVWELSGTVLYLKANFYVL